MEKNNHLCLLFTLIILASGDQYSYEHDYQLIDMPLPVKEGCNFPRKWEGNWFQSGVHQTIRITSFRITTKGVCLEATQEKFLVHNERENCFRCLVFHEKHRNVLQYKETFCLRQRGSLKSLCSRITGDAYLFSMFRINGNPIDCPFRAPFTFTYNRGHGECKSPISSIHSCTHQSNLLFNYQACPDVPGTESTIEELHCLASWKEGSSKFLVGLIRYQHHASYEERFRCFAYERIKKGQFNRRHSMMSVWDPVHLNRKLNLSSDALYRIAMSGDATCNGLTPRDGSRTLTLSKGPTPKVCQFPSWLRIHDRWHTLDQNTVFKFTNTHLHIRNGSKGMFGLVNPTETFDMTASCSHIIEKIPMVKAQIVVHSVSKCKHGYICASIFRRDTHIVELQMGHKARRIQDACDSSHFNENHQPFITLVSPIPAIKGCPQLGKYELSGLAISGVPPSQHHPNCDQNSRYLSSGCNPMSTIELKHCHQSQSIEEYKCHGWWELEGVSYLITSPTEISTRGTRKLCFMFKEEPISDHFVVNNKHSSFSSLVPSASPLKLLEKVIFMSNSKESCYRHITPGLHGHFAFNLTGSGECGDSKTTRRSSSLKLLVILFGIHYFLVSFNKVFV